MYRLAPVAMILLLSIAFIGFWPSFFSQLTSVKGTYLLHGVTSTIWIILLGVQAWFINAKRPRLHKSTGIGGLILAPLMIGGFALICLDAAQTTAQNKSLFAKIYAAPLMVFDLIFLFLTPVFIYFSLKLRINKRVHASFMLLTSLALIAPSLGRLLVNYIPGFLITGPETTKNFGVSFWVSMFITITCTLFIAWKTKIERYVWGIAAAIFSLSSMLYVIVGNEIWWREFVISLAALDYQQTFFWTAGLSFLVIYLGWEHGKVKPNKRLEVNDSRQALKTS